MLYEVITDVPRWEREAAGRLSVHRLPSLVAIAAVLDAKEAPLGTGAPDADAILHHSYNFV